MNLSKHLKLALISVKIEAMDRTQDLIPFIFIVIGTIIRIAITLIFFKAIYLQVNTLGGWDINQMYVLIGTYFFINSVSWITYKRGLAKIPRWVERGDLDIFLIKPVNLRIFLIYRFIDVFFTTPQLLVSIGLIFYGIKGNFNMVNFTTYLILLFLAVIIHYSVLLILYSFNFFKVLQNTFYLSEEIIKLGQYPITIYKGVFRIIFSIIIPIAFIFSVPSKVIFGQATVSEIFTAVFLAVIFYILSVNFWNYGLTKYKSARG